MLRKIFTSILAHSLCLIGVLLVGLMQLSILILVMAFMIATSPIILLVWLLHFLVVIFGDENTADDIYLKYHS